ncbi:MAG: OmpA family protein [Thiolinea sp.]
MRILIRLGLLVSIFCGATATFAGDTINYGERVGIFAEDFRARLDVGIRAMKEEIPPDHESWATRLRIKRLDGPNQGPVNSDHLIGIFAEDGRARLDIGARAMKEEVPADHRSWATRVVFKRLDGPDEGPVQYGELLGIFSEDNRARLDIGIRAVKEEVPPNHESWATRLRIKKAELPESVEPTEQAICDQLKSFSIANLQVNFELDSAQLTNDARKLIAQLAAAIKACDIDAAKFEIQGHTDASGSTSHNQDLSERRAKSVIDELAGIHGLERSGFSPVGHGETRLLDQKNPSSGVNRRVEIHLR